MAVKFIKNNETEYVIKVERKEPYLKRYVLSVCEVMRLTTTELWWLRCAINDAIEKLPDMQIGDQISIGD